MLLQLLMLIFVQAIKLKTKTKIMKKAILIERITKTLYLKDGLVLSLETAEEKLQHNIFGETKTMVEETEIDAFFYKNKKDVDLMFWNYMNERKLNSDNYYVIYLK